MKPIPGQLSLFGEVFPLANDQPIEPPQPHEDSYYFQEIWPLIVARQKRTRHD